MLGQRQRQYRPPAFGEHLNRSRAEPVADRLQPIGIGARGEPVGQLGEPDAGLGGLAFGPLVPVDPDLHRVREIGTYLHKRRPKVIVPEVEVVTGNSPLGFGEREPHRRTGTLLVAKNTGANSCATPIAATPPDRSPPAGPNTAASDRSCGRPCRSAPPRSCCRRRSGPPPCGTRCRSSPGSPARGIGQPRWAVINDATCPLTCRFGKHSRSDRSDPYIPDPGPHARRAHHSPSPSQPSLSTWVEVPAP